MKEKGSEGEQSHRLCQAMKVYTVPADGSCLGWQLMVLLELLDPTGESRLPILRRSLTAASRTSGFFHF
jgi:hypothetical protein